MSGRKSDLATMYSRSGGATIKPRVMVVDDEPTNIRILTEALQQDYDVIIATSAGEAFRVLESGERPHLLLLDIMMPDMDGLEMCLVLKGRQELQHIPVIFITALSDVASEERGFEVGAVDYIHKPISIPSVRARVRTHISLQGMLDHLLELNKTLDEKLHQLDQLNWRLRQQQGKLGRAEASRDLFERVFMTTSEGIAVLDERGHVIAVNSSFTRITGYREEEVLGHYYEMLDGHADQNQQQRILDHLAEHDHWLGERFNRRKSGEVFSELRSISTIRSDEGYIVHYVTVFNDITNLKETEQRLEELTWRDPVTGLSNRSLFLDQLQSTVKFCQRGDMATAVIIVDINNFRFINETYGFDCGDRLIRIFAKRIKDACFEDDSIARLSGDEFGIVLAPRNWTLSDAYRVALQVVERIQEDLREPIPLENDSVVKIAVTAGVALFPTDISYTPSQALRNAETAHRNAKGANRSVSIFEDSMSEEIRRQMAVEVELIRALARNEIVMFAQPQFSPQGQLAGIELLARWDHPQRGLLGPGEFIPFAERTRQIVELERHMIRRSLKILCDAGFERAALRCSVNISAKHLAEDDFADAMLALISETAYPPELVTFEITESVMLSDVDQVVAKMKHVRRAGCTFSLDDFGTGYSSLSHLRRLPISEIKIDRSFVLSALTESMSAGIVEMVQRIGESMGVRVVAEGVETQAHADFLRSGYPGVYLQGYFFGRPQALRSFLDDKSWVVNAR